MIKQIEIADFLNAAQNIPVVDVRTPAEFIKGHIPIAVNLPLFTDEERVIVGTLYKQEGKDKALLKGLELVGPRLAEIVKEAEKISPEKNILVHCWRGGMRSNSVAWLLDIAGFNVSVLKGGYKAYRNWVIQQFEQEHQYIILGGMTGCGKTQVLQELKKEGEQIIDLEELAQHQGSSFGSMGILVQPSQEHFENMLAACIAKVDKSKQVWLEDESITIGRICIPNPLWQQMRAAPVVKMVLPLECRVKILVDGYSRLAPEFLKASIERIAKKLGGQHATAAIEALESNNYEEVVRIVLVYYDKTYAHGQNKRDMATVTELAFDSVDPFVNAKKVRKCLTAEFKRVK